ncbi:SRPBCC family protein [Aurantibacter crassamenti]|uniref:SRPBCC family protein n=1 Tax=Aurantibacter crassamenti TaxID=1837375 RepID=UPI00193AC75E|nr:SRPBCC family protein [Aurantibacter crassamenti]MBM1108015.1 SRPBCC family protein [Aurantibacter crassamenti]
MHLESPKKTVSKSKQEVFEFLCDIKNFEKLMPSNISKFEVLNEDTFIFALKGMPEITLKVKEKVPFEKIVLGSAEGKLNFTLTSDIEERSDNATDVTLHFKGEFNAMMAMMIKNPITNFIGTLSQNMDQI